MKRAWALILAVTMLVGMVPQFSLHVTAAKEDMGFEIDNLRYDDHVDLTGKSVEIIDAGTPTSYQVGYGVEENTVPDTAVVAMEGDTLVATGIGTAAVKIDGETYEIAVTAAPVSLLLIIGQSNAEGMESNANQSIACSNGQVYSTYAKSNGLTGDAGLTVENAGNYVPSSLAGTYSTVNINGTDTKLSAYPVNSLTEAGAGKYGMDSGLAYEWVKQTDEKVWVVNAAHGASSITSWQKGAENYDQAVTLFTVCQQVLQKEIAAGHYTFSHMGYYWNQGCADETKTAEWYVSQYLAMHDNLKIDLACDMDNDPATADNTLEFGNIVLVQAGHSTATGYRKGTYEDTYDSFFMTYKELELRGPRVAQIWMANNPELTDVHIVSTLAQDWVTMPDGSDGVAEYFQSAYTNGTVDYTTQVKQSASWYTPTTPAAVKDSIHYNQIGYNEIGRESARNTLYILGILQKPDVETTVTLLNWTGYELADTIKTSVIGTSDTLVVPLVYPCYESKAVTYTLSDGLSWYYYDLLDTGVDGGTLTASIGTQTVTVTGREYYSYRFELVDGEMVSVSNDTFRENQLTATTVNTYTLEDNILLRHDKEWIVEFNSVAADRFMALASSKSSTDGMFYFFKSKSGSGVLSIGEYKDGLYQNYGLKQSQINVDWMQPHVYRFQNVINSDGTNIIHIYVDGKWVGTATNLIINDVLQSTDNMYLSGKDFSFSSIGCSGLGLGAGQMTYLAVHESGQHSHSYIPTVTAPTCTEQGYTALVCTVCGDTQLESQTMDISDLFVWNSGKMIIATTGACESYDYWQASDYVDISAFDSIVIKTANTIHTGTTAGLAFYDADKHFISGVRHTDGIGEAYGTLTHTLEVPENAVYVRSTWYLPSHPNYISAFGEFSCTATGQYVPATGHNYELASTTAPTCTAQGTSVYVCSACGDSYTETVNRAEHTYNDGVCIVCGVSILGSDWIAPDFAQGDYTMVVLPDTQSLVQGWPQIYYNQMQWIADNRDELNIQAVLRMGDMVNTNNDTQWTVCEAGTDILNAAGIPWMPMRGNHDDSAWFNRYYDYVSYGTDKRWFGGSYQEGKLDHTYWFVTVGEREYLILSLGWAPSWDVLTWAQGIVEEHSDKSVILLDHAYMNKDGTLLSKGDAHCVSSYYSGYPDGDDVWAAFKDYGNMVLAMGGHIHSPDVVTWVDPNGAGRDVTSLLFDRQDDDTKGRYAMIALLTFHEDSNAVDINWYSTRYDALYREKNQFSITVPHVCDHSYTCVTTEPTCTEGGGTRYTCTLCSHSYVSAATEPLGHDYAETVVSPTCTTEGYTTMTCARCGNTELKPVELDITELFQWTDGVMIQATSGRQISDKNWMASDYLNISAYPRLWFVTANTATVDSTIGFAFYDADKKYISGVRHTDQSGVYGVLVHDIEVPENAVYIRSTWYSQNHASYDPAFGEFWCTAVAYKTPVLGHDYESVVTPPTCTEQGYTTHTCHCGDGYVDSYVEATGHCWGDWEVVQEPTATESGMQQRTCAHCGETEQEEIPRLEILYGDANGDGSVNALDLILLRQYLASWEVTLDLNAADANGDGTVNALDLILLRQFLAGWDVTLGP